MSIEDRLRQAIESGEVVKITYHGGSQPGSFREIAPISIKNGKLSARCFTSNAIKFFAIENIVIVDGETQASSEEWRPGLVKTEQYVSIIEFLEKKRDLFVQLGWHIESGQNHLSLHRKFKTGKPLKGSEVSLDYEQYAYDLVVGADGEIHEDNHRIRQRPWTVRGKNKATKTYSHLDKAAEVFLE